MTEREEFIRERLQNMHKAAKNKNHEQLAEAFDEAQKHALTDVAYLLGVLDVLRKRVKE